MNFSVLMSLYYKEKPSYLDECFKSLHNQTKPADEIIVVFDGPVGNELEAIVERWCDFLPVKIVRLAENVGLGNALNIGVEHCSYDVVARMDTDDICLPFRFETQLKKFHDDPELSVLGSDVDEFDGDMCVFLGRKLVPYLDGDIKKYLKKRNPFNHMTVVFRKSAIISVGGYQHHMYMEDYYLWLRCASAGYKMQNIDDVLVNVRAGNAMLSRRRGGSYIKSEYLLMKRKMALGLTGVTDGIRYFLLRSIMRLLPVNLLSLVYKNLFRKKCLN